MSPPLPQAVDCHRQPVEGARLLARAFDQGRRLMAWAPGREDHAHHVAVEFIHPAVTGSVALPAASGTPPAGHDEILLLIGDIDQPLAKGAGAQLFIPVLPDARIMFSYHLLWELVQLAMADQATPEGDSTQFLYPFLDGRSGDDAHQLRASAEAKAAESARVSGAAMASNTETLPAVADAVNSASTVGGRILTIGNGGSACDAARAVRLFDGIGLAGQSLSGDYAVITALANDLGPDKVFARQIEAMGRPGDVVIGFSTSGTSANLLAAFDQARAQGLVTIGFAGYDGAGFAAHPTVDYTLAVSSQSVHRIQEAQATMLDALIREVATRGANSDSGSPPPGCRPDSNQMVTSP